MSAGDKAMKFIAAIFVVSAAAGLWTMLLAVIIVGFDPAAIGMTVVVTLFALPFVAVAGVVIGWPVSELLAARRITSPWLHLLIGIGAGCLSGLLAGALLAGEFWPRAMLFDAGPGAAGGVYWWWAVSRHIDDNPWIDVA